MQCRAHVCVCHFPCSSNGSIGLSQSMTLDPASESVSSIGMGLLPCMQAMAHACVPSMRSSASSSGEDFASGHMVKASTEKQCIDDGSYIA